MIPPRRVVQVEVTSGAAELAADALWQLGPSAVGQEDLAGGRVRLTADVRDVQLLDLPTGATVHIVELDSDAYLDLWRQWATPMRAGRHVVLHPAWVPIEGTDSDDLTVLIDPGRAFGSGSHPSSRLVIAALEEHLLIGSRVLDVGTGSGVLAVGACLLGAAGAVAVDIDPEAVEVTEANALVNGVADLIDVSTTPLALVPGSFDIVVANIGARVLCELAGDLMRHTAVGGLLVLSGLLEHQADEVVACFPAFHEVARLTEAGWVAPVLRAAG